jgi:hypothetical protein
MGKHPRTNVPNLKVLARCVAVKGSGDLRGPVIPHIHAIQLELWQQLQLGIFPLVPL